MARELTAIADTAMWIPASLQPLYQFSPWLLLALLLLLPALGGWLLLRGARPRVRVNGGLLLLLAVPLLLGLLWPAGMRQVLPLVGVPWPWW